MLSTVKRPLTLAVATVGIAAGLLSPPTPAHASTRAGTASQKAASTTIGGVALPTNGSAGRVITLSNGQSLHVNVTGSERALTAVERSKMHASAWWGCWYDQKTLWYGWPNTMSYSLNVKWCGNGSVVFGYQQWVSESITGWGQALGWEFWGVLNNSMTWYSGGSSVIAYTRGWFVKTIDPVWTDFPKIWIAVNANGGHQEQYQY
jgi:hypothetical protein